MKIYCFECYKGFIPSASNTKILGPYVEITCPYCLDVYNDKLLNCVDKQVGYFPIRSTAAAIKMIRIAEFIELNSSDYYRKKGLRHDKKKVRNVRD